MAEEPTKEDRGLSVRPADYFSLPNLVQTMNANRFGVVDKIMAAPLVTLDQVFA